MFFLTTAIFAYNFIVFLRVQPASDLAVHIAYAQGIHSVADLTSPHFLYELVLKALHGAGVSYAHAATWVLGACYGGMALLIVSELERRHAELTTFRMFVVVPALLVACHVFLLTILQPNMYYGYFVPISYHNPTQQLNKFFGLWIYFLYCAGFLDAVRPSVRRAVSIGALSIPSALAKPSFLIAFLPAATLQAAWDAIRRRWDRVLPFVIAIAPAVLVLLWQARKAYGTADAPAQIFFAPFLVFELKATLYKLPASLAFPLVVWFGAWRTGVRDAKLRFVWMFCAIALFATLCLAERGREMQGNFAWTGQTAVFLVYVESVLQLLTRPELTRWRRPAWAIFGVHVACGLIWYAAVFFPQRPNWL